MNTNRPDDSEFIVPKSVSNLHAMQVVAENNAPQQQLSEKTVTILIINGKGGCGKTTISTNLACWLEEHAGSCVIVDCDGQASSLDWYQQRQLDHKTPTVIDGVTTPEGVTRSWHLRATRSADYVILDAPANADDAELSSYLQQADLILIPVLPSPIDVRATTRFISRIVLHPQVKGSNKRLGVVANRIRSNTIAYRKLKNFLNTLRVPIISELKDSQAYLHANDQGKALFELTRRSKEEIEKWDHFGHWIQRRRKRKADLSTV